MGNCFENMIQDVFNIPQFVEYFTYGQQRIKCVSYHMDIDPSFTTFGLDDNVNFYITCKASDFTPQKNIHITFRNQLYRIDSFELDAFGLSWKILVKNSFKKKEVKENV